MRTLNDLARAGLPVPDGVVLTQEAHEVFLEASGVVEGVKVAAWSEENLGRRLVKYDHVTARCPWKRNLSGRSARL